MRWWPIPRHYLSVLDDGTKAFSAPYFSGMQIRRKNSSVTLAPGPLMIPGHNIAEDLEIRDYGRVFPGGGCKVTAMWPVDARVSGGTVLMALLLRAATGKGPTVEAAAVAGQTRGFAQLDRGTRPGYPSARPCSSAPRRRPVLQHLLPIRDPGRRLPTAPSGAAVRRPVRTGKRPPGGRFRRGRFLHLRAYPLKVAEARSRYNRFRRARNSKGSSQKPVFSEPTRVASLMTANVQPTADGRNPSAVVTGKWSSTAPIPL